MAASWQRTILGASGLSVTPLGLASSYGVGTADVERAIERGINYVYWGSRRRSAFGRAVANAARRRREDLVLVVQSYTRAASLMRPSLERALRALGTDYTDLLLLGWWNDTPPPRILEAALKLRDQGKARHLMISCHHRPSFERFARDPYWGAMMVRYNAAHPGAETDVFQRLPAQRPGIVAYTATRWGQLPSPRYTPRGEATPRGSDCYRFALTHSSVDLVLCGPKNGAELDEALAALDRGPMSTDELAWMKRVGAAIRARPTPTALFSGRSA
jgi:aryl-alcohol dehydrogenase-like predicted oxidoreductase